MSDLVSCVNCGQSIRTLGSVDYKGDPIWTHGQGGIHETQCKMFATPPKGDTDGSTSLQSGDT